MRILILGSEGFIGKHLVNYYLEQQHEVCGCDVVTPSSDAGYSFYFNDKANGYWASLFKNQNFDVCINASGSGNVGSSIEDPLKDFDANCHDVIKIMDAIRCHNKTIKYLHISSAAVYGNPDKLPVSESDSLSPFSPYGWHKMMSEQICKEYFELYNMNVAIVRPFSVYGNGLRKQLLWDVCNKLKNDDAISLFGTGEESRDFIHINDLVLLMSSIIESSNFQYDIYNAATGSETFIKDIARIYEEYYPGDKRIVFSGEVKVGDPRNWRADIDKVRGLGFKQTVSLEEGIRNYINWYRNI